MRCVSSQPVNVQGVTYICIHGSDVVKCCAYALVPYIQLISECMDIQNETCISVCMDRLSNICCEFLDGPVLHRSLYLNVWIYKMRRVYLHVWIACQMFTVNFSMVLFCTDR